MPAINRTPQNTNFIQPSKFVMSFARLPTVAYFCKTVNIPGVSLGSIEYPTASLNVPLAGTKLEYNEFEMDFFVDEELASWNEVYLWMQAIASPQGTEERTRLNNLANEGKPTNSYYSEGTLISMSALNNPVTRTTFYRMFPVSLSDVTFDTSQDADNILTATVRFRYARFEITKA